MDDTKLESWNRFMLKYVKPLFTNGNNLEEYYEFLKKKQPPFYPQSHITKKFFDKIKDDNRFDNELKEFFAFLYSCGFFMENIISFEEWLKMKNWENPSIEDLKSETILELLIKDKGVQELKQRLRWLSFINREDGF